MSTSKSQAGPQLVAWEITRSCNLYCAHCRASSHSGSYSGELSTDECFRLIDQIAEVGKPILILTGGEPLLREDVFDIGKYAADKGFRVVMGTNGTMVSESIAARMKNVPLSRISVSLDFPTRDLQDDFRGWPGAFEAAVAGIKNAQGAGVEVQINMTVTRQNARFLPDMVNLALELGVAAFHPFMLVPTGRGRGLADEELSPEDYESTLRWIYNKQQELGDRLNFKPTDAPHYYRIVQQCGGSIERGHGHRAGHGHPAGACHGSGTSSAHGLNAHTRGCLAGTGFCFISHTGRVQGCGYLDLEAGNIRRNTFAEVWRDSALFNEIRDLDKLKGKCGRCEYKSVCGGCRARAYEVSGDYLAAEPYCVYKPGSVPIEVA